MGSHRGHTARDARDIRETLGWLKTAEKSFDFWNNPDDAVYDAP